MAGAGYKLFTTGSVLTAADVNTYLQEQVVMVFANATARTTALSGVLAEGMVTYLKDTDALEIYSGAAWIGYGSGDITGITTGATSGLTGGVTSGTADLKLNTTAKGGLLVGSGSGTVTELAVGSNDQVLTADSTAASGLKWASAAATDSYTQLASVSLSGSQVNISSISGSYKRLVLVIQDFFLATANNLALRFNNSSTASSYGQVGVTTAGAYTNSQSFLWATYQTSVGSNQANMFWMVIEDYANTNSWKVASAYTAYNDGSADQSEMHSCRWENTSAITEINILTTAGNLSGGTAILYGVK